MAYGFSKPKMKPCLGGMKHKWEFVENTRTTRSSTDAYGSSFQMSLKGLYVCKCGMRKLGPHNPNQPKADLRDQVVEA